MTKAPSVEPVLRSRLLPRISFRMMMLLTAFCAVIAALARVAGNGGELAASIMAALAFLAAVFAAFALLFLFSWCVAVIRKPSGYAAIAIGCGMILTELMGFPLMGRFAEVFLILTGLFLMFVPARFNEESIRSNPFADGQLPPQIIPPREQRT